eukprot:264225_1
MNNVPPPPLQQSWDAINRNNQYQSHSQNKQIYNQSVSKSKQSYDGYNSETTSKHNRYNNTNNNIQQQYLHHGRHQHANSSPNWFQSQNQNQYEQHKPVKSLGQISYNNRKFSAPQQYGQHKPAVNTTTINRQYDTENKQQFFNAPKCHCGQSMMHQQKCNIPDKEIRCHGCEFIIPEDQIVFYCTACLTNYFCDSCSNYIPKCNTKPMDPKHDSAKLYFLYNKNETSGPYLKHEIITMYVTKKLKEDKLYIMVANVKNKDNKERKWCKLTFPQEIFNDKNNDDKERKQLMAKCEEINAEFKNKHPDLYENLIQNPFTGRMKQIEEPEDIPPEERGTSITKSRWVRRYLGKAIAIVLTINIVLHCIPTMVLSGALFLVYCCVYYCCNTRIEMADAHLIFFIFFLFSGMAITPIINVNMVLTEMNMWDEIQSWMISYIIWGIISLIASISHFVLIYFHKDIRILDNAILLIMGVDFGDFDVGRELKDNENQLEMFGIIFIFPSLASLLPAITIGFIANYYLEEKFDLRCSEDISISSEHLCFEEQYGCCEIISSHDIKNAYVFIGGLASNVLFAWAVIRIAGYLLVNGFPKLSMFARKKK